MSKQLLCQSQMSELEQRNICVTLPNRERLHITIGMKATGHELFVKVCDLVQIRDSHFFGLSIVRNNEYIFMDLEEKISKYFSKEWKKEASIEGEKFRPPFVVFFRVQYYVENGKIISSKTARHLYYCNLKDQILRSRCMHKEEVYFLLAAYGLQADFGNYRKNVHVGRYFEPETYFPQWVIAKRGTEYILSHAPEVHKEQQGLTVKEALLKFIKESCLLEDVPIHYYGLQKDKKTTCQTIVLGLTLRGIDIYQEVNHVRQLLYDFPWSSVEKLTLLGKKFEIQSDRLPSAQKLVYYTSCSFRSRHLLQLLTNSHRFYLNVQPIMKHIQKIEEAEEKCYRESYISDPLEMNLDQLDQHSYGRESGRTSIQSNCLSHQCTTKHGNSHTSCTEAKSKNQMPVEMEKSYYSTISHGSSEINGCSKGRAEDNFQDDDVWPQIYKMCFLFPKRVLRADKAFVEVELSVDEPKEVLVDDPWQVIQIKDEDEGEPAEPPVLDQDCWQEVELSVDEPEEVLVDALWQTIHIKDAIEGESVNTSVLDQDYW